MQTDKLYRVKEAALILNVSVETVQRWIRTKKLAVAKLPGGQYRIPESEILRLVRSGQTEGMRAN